MKRLLEEKRLLDHANVNYYGTKIKLPLMVILAIVLFIGSILVGQLIPELLWLRATVAIIFILFLPGFLALEALGIRPKSFAESIIMALGLSIAIVMLLGMIANFILPFLGINEPLSIIPLTVLLSALVAALSIVVAYRGSSMGQHFLMPILRIRPFHLYLVLIPIVTLLGVVIQNSFSLNIGLIVSLLLICSAGVLARIGKIPKEAYPLTLFVTSLSLLLHTSLISDFIWGWDINWEYYSASQVIDMSIWSADGHSIIDSMLSIVILGPILSIMSGVELGMVLRIVYPLIFSFVPVGLYILYRKQTNEEIAFLSSFFIISLITFFAELPQLARQEIAELFVVLLLLLIADTDIKRNQKISLFIFFSFSLIVSHYSTYYFFIAIILIGYILGVVLEKRKSSDGRVSEQSLRKKKGMDNGIFNLYPQLLLLIIFFSIIWYASTAHSAPLLKLIDVVDMMFSSILGGMFNASTIEGIDILGNRSGSLLEEIWKISQIVFAIAIILGVIYVLRRMKNKENSAFVSINVAALLVLGGCMVLPYLASSLNSARVYHLALLFLAPSLIIGAMKIIEKVMQLPRPMRHPDQHSAKIMLVVIILSLAFNTGLIHELTGEESNSFALDENYDFPRFSTGEVVGVKWTLQMGPSHIFVDEHRWMLFHSFTATPPTFIFPPASSLPHDSMVFLGKFNIDNHEMYRGSTHISWEDSGMIQIQQVAHKVYVGGPSEVWYFA